MNFWPPILTFLFIQTAWPLMLSVMWRASLSPNSWLRAQSWPVLALIGAAPTLLVASVLAGACVTVWLGDRKNG